MNLIAIMPARNEAWIIGASLRAALLWCDEVVVLLHACTDHTSEIVCEVGNEHPGRVHVIAETCVDWPEMGHRQRLLEEARKRKATHVAIVDADEILTGNLLPAIRMQIQQMAPGGMLHVGMPCIWRGLDQYRVDRSIWANRFDLALAFGDRSDLTWAPTNGYDHHCREPHGSHVGLRAYGLAGGVMHLQWASWRRVVAKHALYKIIERIKYPQKPVGAIERLYSLALDERGLQTEQTPAEWWAPYERIRPYIDRGAEPWQESECRRLWKAHGRDTFSGLDLFGVVD